jgi:hypothetical protein
MLAKFLYRTCYIKGFSRCVTSTTAPIASGWSESCRVGFAPTGKQRLDTAHESRAAAHPDGRIFRREAPQE